MDAYSAAAMWEDKRDLISTTQDKQFGRTLEWAYSPRVGS
jgi:hypothetical protein